MIVCVHCGAEVWWSLPRPEDACANCGKPIASSSSAVKITSTSPDLPTDPAFDRHGQRGSGKP